MKVKSKIIAILLCAVLAFCVIAVFTACEETVEPPAPEYKVYSVTLQYNGKNIDGNVLNADVSAGTLQLTTKVVKDDGAEATVTYASSVSEVATVSKDGLVTLAGKGETVISATAGDKKHEIVLVVADDYSVADSYTITVNGGTASVTSAPEGTYVTLTANVPEHQDFIEWDFSDNVSWINGNVCRMPAGDVTVAAKFEAMKYTLNVVGATVVKADEVDNPTGSDGGNTEGGELPEYDMNVYQFEYGTEISVEAIAEPAGKMFVGWDYGVENNRVGEMGIGEYAFEMPGETTTVWAIFSEKNNKVLTAGGIGGFSDGARGAKNIENGVPNGESYDEDLDGLSGYRLAIPANTGADNTWPENIRGSALDTTQKGSHTMKAIFKNRHESLPLTIELFVTFCGNLATTGEITIQPGETFIKYFSAGLGIYQPWWGFAVRKDVGGSSDDTVFLDIVLGSAPTYPNGDKLLQVSGNADYVHLGEYDTCGSSWGAGSKKTVNNDIGCTTVGHRGTDFGGVPGYISAEIKNMPEYDAENPTTTVYVRFINCINEREKQRNQLKISIGTGTAPETEVDSEELIITKVGEVVVFKLEVPRTADDNGKYYFTIFKNVIEDDYGPYGHSYIVQLTYNNVMGYTEEAV